MWKNICLDKHTNKMCLLFIYQRRGQFIFSYEIVNIFQFLFFVYVMLCYDGNPVSFH